MVLRSIAATAYIDMTAFVLTARGVVGALINAGLPVSVVAAQEYAPDHVATASAMMMGFAWGVSGLVFPLVGLLADATSPTAAVRTAVFVLVPAFLMAMRLPEPRRA